MLAKSGENRELLVHFYVLYMRIFPVHLSAFSIPLFVYQPAFEVILHVVDPYLNLEK